MDARLHLLALLTLLCPPPRPTNGQCPLRDAPVGMVMAPVGSHLVLKCGGDEAEAVWTFNGRLLGAHHRRHLVNASGLSVRAAKAKDTGNYGCSRNGTLVRAVRLLVGEAPKTPRISCQLRSYIAPLRCEWHSPEMKRLTRCALSHRNSLEREPVLRPCQFYTGRRTCVCTAPHLEGDHEHFYLSLIVDNGIACTASTERMYPFDSLLCPGMPLGVRVGAVTGWPRRLTVRWAYPASWSLDFYRLKFQITYSVRALPIDRTVTVSDTEFLIADAVPGLNYSVRVCARDEFNRGVWSAWSPETYGTPWADRRTNMIPEEETEGLPSTDVEGELHSEDDTTPQGSRGLLLPHLPPLVPCVVGSSLFLVSLLSLLIVLRYWKKWKAKGSGKDQGEGPMGHQAVRLMGAPQAQPQDPNAYEACSAETPLSEGEPGTLPPEEEGEGEAARQEGPAFHIINPGYYYYYIAGDQEQIPARERESPSGVPN